MMKPNLVLDHEENLNSVLSDFMVKLKNTRDAQGDESLAKSLPQEMYKWAFECE